MRKISFPLLQFMQQNCNRARAAVPLMKGHGNQQLERPSVIPIFSTDKKEELRLVNLALLLGETMDQIYPWKSPCHKNDKKVNHNCQKISHGQAMHD